MQKVEKIKEIGLTKLNNPEYTNYMSRFANEIKVATPQGIGITDDHLASLEANILKMNDLVAQSRISNDTQRLADLDNERDAIIVYIKAEIENKRKSPLANIKQAGIELYNATHNYIGIQKSPNQQETQQIKGLLLDLAKPQNAPNATTLGLDDVIRQLEKVNTEYETGINDRSHEKLTTSIDNSNLVRSENDGLYEYIVAIACATHLISPTEQTKTFVAQTNIIIDETRTLYHQRKAHPKAKKNT